LDWKNRTWLRETQRDALGQVADVRELKSAARNKTPARKIARSLKRSEGATPAKGIQPRIVARLARVKNTYSQLRHQAKDRGTAVTN